MGEIPSIESVIKYLTDYINELENPKGQAKEKVEPVIVRTDLRKEPKYDY